MRVIKNEIESETDSLRDYLFDAIKDIAGKGTNEYMPKLYDENSTFTACQIIESGFYWPTIKAKLIELNKLDLIEDSSLNWVEELTETE